MAVQQYKSMNFRDETMGFILTMQDIIEEYTAQSYRLTVRQLYYQLVARGIIENTERSYKRVTSIVNDAKLAGLLDWEAIEDRTREFIRRPRWESAAQIIEAAADGFHMDMWVNQKRRVFVIVEKEALAGVLERACRELDVPLLAARGYPSGTVLREFAESDLIPCFNTDQIPMILHLGDHDPSGIDMSRDLAQRFFMFCTGNGDEGAMFGSKVFQRIALTRDQIEEQNPPPNPAKTTDARFASYMAEHGSESWELDALRPDYLDHLVRKHINKYIDADKWLERESEVEEMRDRIKALREDL